MTRQINKALRDCIERFKAYPKTKRFNEGDLFPDDILPLVERMRRYTIWNVDDSDREMLDDTDLLEDLFYILNNGLNKDAVNLAAIFLRQLYITTRDNQIPERIINRLLENKLDEKRTCQLLYAIPPGVDGLHRLKPFLEDVSKHVRRMALDVIYTSRSKKIRPLIENVLRNSPSSHELLVAMISIKKVGNKDSVEVIKPYLHHKSGEVQSDALFAIAVILGDEGNQLYIDALLDRKYREKHQAVLIIVEHCGDEAIPALSRRIKTILSGKRLSVGHHADGHTELTTALEFLLKFEGDKTVESTFKYVTRKLDKLTEQEREYLSQKQPAFYQAIISGQAADGTR
ncbi:hypothetical protein MNBD_GAMMA14-2428 [hydrothermal vent metagenome]|uniref:HEAT repeat domain-containing protein n=1 Tax=hydrothermal vent metagenome TaxID=652676 RepID=A0A3B0YDQ8_9ZZZZ